MSPDDGAPPRENFHADVNIPPNPGPRASELWASVPFTLSERGQYTIGWQKWPDRKGGPQFAVFRRGSLGMLKVASRYPLTDEGWEHAWQSFANLDPATAEHVRARLAARAEAPEPPEPEYGFTPPPREPKEPLSVRLANTFTGLGVRVRNGQVYPYPTLGQPALGPVEGARAEITDPTKAQMVRAGLTSGLALGAVIGPFALAPGLLRKSKAVAFVVCANGRVHEHKLDGTAAIRAAQRDAVKFNVLAGPAPAPAQVPTQPPPSPPPAGERLAEVTRLHDEGLLTDEEYQAKRAEIISQL
jgi:hypothetical protein